MRSSLILEGLRLPVRIGVTAEERISLTTVSVDIEWRGEHEREGRALIDYAEVSDLVAGLSNSEAVYIEDLAESLIEALSDRYRWGGWKVVVRKESPPTSLVMRRASFVLESDASD